MFYREFFLEISNVENMRLKSVDPQNLQWDNNLQ